MVCVPLYVYLIVGVVAAVTTATTTRNQLMLLFLADTGDTPTGSLYPEFQKRIASALSLPFSSVLLGPLLKHSYLRSYTAFTIQSENVTVLDSYATEESYNVYLEKWRQVLARNDTNLTAPFSMDRIEMVIDPNYSEISENSVTVEQGNDPASPSDTPLHDLQQALDRRYEVMQLRLMGFAPFNFTLSYHPIDQVVSGLGTCLSTLLSIPQDRMQLFNVAFDTNSSLVVQFTVYPALAEDLKTYSQSWTEAIALQAPVVKTTFPNADFSYPPTARTGVTTLPPVPSNSRPGDDAASGSVNAGLVAGSVVGALAAVGALGGATYWLKKRRDAKKEADGPQEDEDDEEDNNGQDDDRQDSMSARN